MFKEVLEGRRVKILETSDRGKKGLEGKVTRELKNEIEIKTGKNVKKINKGEIFLMSVFVRRKKLSIKGEEIAPSLEERLR